MIKYVIGLGMAAAVAVSPPSQAGQPSYLPFCTRNVAQSSSRDGVASWYGEEFQGSPTASGESYNMNALTAAHPNLPLGTRIRVTNLTNDRSLILRINDRGPYVPGRFLDVSRAAARLLGFAAAGKAHVRVQVLRLPHNSRYHLVCPGARFFSMN
ncbi:MAG: septal ring lytic transglycosylase RlpA family protein [Terriglobia bacterium]